MFSSILKSVAKHFDVAKGAEKELPSLIPGDKVSK